MLLRSLPRVKMGVARTCAMRITYTHIYHVRTDWPAIMSVVVLHWAAISVLGMEYGSLPCWQTCYFDLLDETTS